MPNVNRVTLAGNLTRDPELKYTSSDMAVCNLGIAVNRKWRSRDGEDREEVTFVDLEAWGKTAEAIDKYFAKGRPIFIEGRLKLEQWEQDGQKRSKMRVVVESFQFLDSRKEGDSGGAGQNRTEGRREPAPTGSAKGDINESEIPF